MLSWDDPKVTAKRVRVRVGDADEAIRARQNFAAGNLRGGYGMVDRFGDLRDEDRAALQSDMLHAKGPTYVVWSYDTPIAWERWDGVVVMPPVRYSITTTEHQNAASHALGLGTFQARPDVVPRRTGKGHSPYGARSGTGW